MGQKYVKSGEPYLEKKMRTVKGKKEESEESFGMKTNTGMLQMEMAQVGIRKKKRHDPTHS